MSSTVHAPRGVLADLGPVQQLRAGRLGRRIPQLLVGLVLYGVSLGLMVRGALGLAPWDVLHSGFIRHVPISLGQAVILFSFVVLVLWIPLREKPGIGTVANAFLVGLSADATLAVLGQPERGPRASPSWSPASCSTAWPPPSTSARSSAAGRATG